MQGRKQRSIDVLAGFRSPARVVGIPKDLGCAIRSKGAATAQLLEEGIACESGLRAQANTVEHAACHRLAQNVFLKQPRKWRNCEEILDHAQIEKRITHFHGTLCDTSVFQLEHARPLR